MLHLKKVILRILTVQMLNMVLCFHCEYGVNERYLVLSDGGISACGGDMPGVCMFSSVLRACSCQQVKAYHLDFLFNCLG